MARYYINIRNTSVFVQDEEGRELDSLNQAREVAVEGALSLMSAEVAKGSLDLRGCIEITDEAGATVLTVPFRDALTITNDDVSQVEYPKA